MPGWHDGTIDAQRSGQVQLVGIIQEQHPDRCRLFMQWKGLEWPVMVDALNLSGIDAVPITYALDEQGTVRFVDPTETEWREFLQAPPARAGAPARDAVTPDLARLRGLAEGGGAAARRAYADALYLWGGEARLDQTVAAYEQAARTAPDHPATQFRLGAAYRRRYDAPARAPGDFQRAVERWARAVELEPNQYIWRRRVQQYGPRLEKPYPFYDWVDEARRAIRARGQQPLPLLVEPGGAEVAAPAERFEVSTGSGREPDPDGRIQRDPGRLIGMEATAVPRRVEPGGVVRVHLVFRPRPEVEGHWNNEGGSLRVWLDPPAGWGADRREASAPSPPDAVSTETRTLDFEVRSPAGARPGTRTLRAYALYYACEGARGVCVYRRQDASLPVEVAP